MLEKNIEDLQRKEEDARRKFNQYKLRSMIVNAEEIKYRFNHLNEQSGPVFKIKNDARLVSVEYLLFKLCVFLPKINFIFKFLLKFNFLKKITIKINLFDLNIYFSKKLEKL